MCRPQLVVMHNAQRIAMLHHVSMGDVVNASRDGSRRIGQAFDGRLRLPPANRHATRAH